MVFYEDGRRVRYNPYNMRFDEYIGGGDEVEVYKVGNDVLKFYKTYCLKVRMDKATAEDLSKISTKRILLPTKVLLDKKHRIKAYKMKYIKSLGQDSFYKLNRRDLSDEMTIMHNDIITLSDNGCLLNDLNIDNTIYHNGVYLIDPGSYDVKYLYKKEILKLMVLILIELMNIS